MAFTQSEGKEGMDRQAPEYDLHPDTNRHFFGSHDAGKT